MKQLSTRTKILLMALAAIIIVSPWLGGGSVEGVVFELIFILTALALFLLMMVFRVEEKELIITKKPWAFIFLGVFIVAGIISSVFSIQIYESWSLFLLFLAEIAIFFILTQITNKNVLKAGAWLFIIMGSLVSLAGFVLYFISASERDFRLDSVLYNPNFLAGYLIGILPVSLIALFLVSSKKIKILLYILNIILSTAFLLTISYTGFVSLVPLLIFIAIYFRKKIFQKQNILLAISLIIIIVLSAFTLQSIRSYTSGQEQDLQTAAYNVATSDSESYRLNYLKTGGTIFSENAVGGIGLGNIKLAYQEIQKTISETPRSTHNVYLDILIEMGILGIIGFVGFILVLFFRNIKLISRENIYFTGLFLGWVGILIHGAIDFIWEKQIIVVHFFVLSGLLYGYYLSTKTSLVITKKFNKIFALVFILLVLLFIGRGVQVAMGQYYHTRGEHHEELSSYNSSIGFYEQAWQINKDPKSLARIGVLQYATNQLEAAEQSALQWIEVSPNDAESYQLLGRVYKLQGNLESAEKQFKKALELSPLVHSSIMLDLIENYYLLGKYDSIISEVDPYIEIYNTQNRQQPTELRKAEISLNLAKMLDYLGETYLIQGDRDKARESWERAISERPAYGIAKNKLQALE